MYILDGATVSQNLILLVSFIITSLYVYITVLIDVTDISVFIHPNSTGLF